MQSFSVDVPVSLGRLELFVLRCAAVSTTHVNNQSLESRIDLAWYCHCFSAKLEKCVIALD